MPLARPFADYAIENDNSAVVSIDVFVHPPSTAPPASYREEEPETHRGRKQSCERNSSWPSENTASAVLTQ
jgi:hypothetical protein